MPDKWEDYRIKAESELLIKAGVLQPVSGRGLEKNPDAKSTQSGVFLICNSEIDGVAKTHQLLRCCNCSRCFDVRKCASLLDNRAPCIWRFLLSHRH
jgi:hypothetical protein